MQFPPIASMISTERDCAWTPGGILDDNQFDRLRNAAEESFTPFLAAEGTIAVGTPALLITAGGPRVRPVARAV